MVSLDVALYWTSLAVSAAGVVLFLWLMRERAQPGNGKRETGNEATRGKTQR